MFITRMRWKAIYCNNKANYNSSERYGLKTLKCSKQVKELVPFENDLIDMIKVIKKNTNICRQDIEHVPVKQRRT